MVTNGTRLASWWFLIFLVGEIGFIGGNYYAQRCPTPPNQAMTTACQAQGLWVMFPGFLAVALLLLGAFVIIDVLTHKPDKN